MESREEVFLQVQMMHLVTVGCQHHPQVGPAEQTRLAAQVDCFSMRLFLCLLENCVGSIGEFLPTFQQSSDCFQELRIEAFCWASLVFHSLRFIIECVRAYSHKLGWLG